MSAGTGPSAPVGGVPLVLPLVKVYQCDTCEVGWRDAEDDRCWMCGQLGRRVFYYSAHR